MSGGCFDYAQYMIADIYTKIEDYVDKACLITLLGYLAFLFGGWIAKYKKYDLLYLSYFLERKMSSTYFCFIGRFVL